LHYANQGVAINQIHNVYQLPASLWKQWPAHSYHGSSEHNSRGVINRFLGYWDGNPATLIPLSPEDAAPLYVEMMGGPAKIMAKGKKLYDQGKYLEASEILNRLVFAQPKNQAAKNLLADVFEQIGYQKESPSLRNSFLQGAYELRTGLPGGVPARSSGPDVVRAMSTENWLDFLGISVDPKKAEGVAFVINLVTPDNGEKYLVEMSNATLTNIKGEQAKNPDLTITLNRTELDQVMMGASTLDDLVKAGKAKFEGDRKPFDQLKGILVTFAPNFEILPGTASAGAKTAAKPDPNPFKVPDLMPTDAAGD
jgi:alkyl sulfatase BDS1-like metallo-beta-lactamase superfamily hydrolase